MAEIENQENKRLALEEASRWHQYIDNFFWILSSFLLTGTGFAVSQALEWDGENWKILILGSSMLLVWFWYRQFHKDIMLKILFYLNKINTLEKQLAIDVLPKEMSEFEKQKISKELFPYADQLKNVKAKGFHLIMSYVIYLSWIVWISFIIEFIVKHWCKLCHYCCQFH